MVENGGPCLSLFIRTIGLLWCLAIFLFRSASWQPSSLTSYIQVHQKMYHGQWLFSRIVLSEARTVTVRVACMFCSSFLTVQALSCWENYWRIARLKAFHCQSIAVSYLFGEPLGGGNWGILPRAPHLQGPLSYKQHYMRLTTLTLAFFRLNKKQLSIPFKFLW